MNAAEIKLLMLVLIVVEVRGGCWVTQCLSYLLDIKGCVPNFVSLNDCPTGEIVYTCCILDNGRRRRASCKPPEGSSSCYGHDNDVRAAIGERIGKNTMMAAFQKRRWGARFMVRNSDNGKMASIYDQNPSFDKRDQEWFGRLASVAGPLTLAYNELNKDAYSGINALEDLHKGLHNLAENPKGHSNHY